MLKTRHACWIRSRPTGVYAIRRYLAPTRYRLSAWTWLDFRGRKLKREKLCRGRWADWRSVDTVGPCSPARNPHRTETCLSAAIHGCHKPMDNARPSRRALASDASATPFPRCARNTPLFFIFNLWHGNLLAIHYNLDGGSHYAILPPSLSIIIHRDKKL